MSSLEAFLNPTYTEKTIKVVISDRFVDEGGKPIPFILKALPQETVEAIAKRSKVEETIDGRKVKVTDKYLHVNRCLVESVVFPDFKNKELCERYGTIDPVDLPKKMLFASEYERLVQEYLNLNGIDGDSPTGEISKK